MTKRNISRRSFLETALAGGTAGVASLTIAKDLFAQASGPLVIGHHCDLTGVISSRGYWHDKAAKAAVEIINKGGGSPAARWSSRPRTRNPIRPLARASCAT